MDKKGFEIQFNWIFVLVAGVAIILFFSAIIIKQKNVSETATKATVLKSVDAIITGASVSTDTTNIISIANSEIEIGCNRVSLGEVSKQYQNMILFAPGIIKGDKIITQTLAFSSPYRTTNFLYVTSPQLMYIIIGNDNIAGKINKTMPQDLKKDFYDSISSIKNFNNYRIKFIITGNMIDFPKQMEKMPDDDVSAVRIEGTDEKGVVEFYQKKAGSWMSKGTSPYIGKASLLGAAYSDTKEAYDCNMQNGFQRLNLVTKVYIGKISRLIQTGSSEKELQCNGIYKDALSSLDKISLASYSFNQANLDAIWQSAKDLSDDNLNAQEHSCILIY